MQCLSRSVSLSARRNSAYRAKRAGSARLEYIAIHVVTLLTEVSMGQITIWIDHSASYGSINHSMTKSVTHEELDERVKGFPGALPTLSGKNHHWIKVSQVAGSVPHEKTSYEISSAVLDGVELQKAVAEVMRKLGLLLCS